MHFLELWTEHNALGISISARKKEDKDMKSIVLEEPRLHKSTLSHKMACEQIVPKTDAECISGK